jgi:DNA polymerase I-like protein with 3'-5' exonuclease and polymerase domains
MEIIVLKQSKYSKGKEKVSFHTKLIDGEIKVLKDLSLLNDGQKHKIISFDFLNILDKIEINENLIFVDIEQLKKQVIGHSKNEFPKNKKPWSFWSQIWQGNDEEKSEEINNSRKSYFGLNEQFTQEEINNQFVFLLESIEKIYKNIQVELVDRNELKRYDEIESFLNTILFERTKKGISVDPTKIKDYLKEVNLELYSIKNKLQLDYGIFSRTDYNNVKRELSKVLPSIADKIGAKDYFKMLKYYKDDFPLINLIFEERKISTNKTILSRIGSLDDKKIYPQFQYFGTVTSRILVESPSLQQLKSGYRDIILHDADKELLYIDYSQFEAGILASEADDQNLIEMYNKADIYSQMNEALKDTPEINREKCKQLFFNYCYGMSQENIKKYSKVDLGVFFKQFPNLKVFQQKLNESFKEKGFIETVEGNKRYKNIENIGTEIEGWLISQRIQGNASLILKKAILNVYNVDKKIEFLIPMHDAVLYQIPKGTYEEKKGILEVQFKKAFKEVCPKINPKVDFKKFCVKKA